MSSVENDGVNQNPLEGEEMPPWFKAYQEEQEKRYREMREENLRLQGRLDERRSAEPEYNPDLPQTDREWQFAEYGLTPAVQLARWIRDNVGEELPSDVDQATQNIINNGQVAQEQKVRYGSFAEKRKRSNEERENALRNLIRSEALGEDDPEAKLAIAAAKGGAGLDEVEQLIFQRRRELREAMGENEGRSATSAAHQAGGAIEASETTGEPRPSESEPESNLTEDILRRAGERAPSDQKVFDPKWSDPGAVLAD